jgi:hypothetical protein
MLMMMMMMVTTTMMRVEDDTAAVETPEHSARASHYASVQVLQLDMGYANEMQSARNASSHYQAFPTEEPAPRTADDYTSIGALAAMGEAVLLADVDVAQ